MLIKLIFIFLVITLQGCSLSTYDHGKEIVGLQLKAPLPSYSVNDVFIFTNGYIERVAAIRGDIVDWEIGGGAYKYKAYKNFSLPKISWETRTRIGTNEMSIPNKRALWPLTPDDDFRMGLKKLISKKGVRWSNRFWFQDWKCETNDPRRITVPAGTFNTVPITCDLMSFSGNTIKTKTWYYSPAVGHYVKRVERSHGNSRRIGKTKEYELTGYIPAFSGLSPLETKEAEAQLQASLERLPSGSQSSWSSIDKMTTRSLSIIGTFEAKDQKLCRDVAFKINSPNKSKSYTSVFCRDEDEWKIALIL